MSSLDEFEKTVEEAFQNHEVLQAGDFVVKTVRELLEQGCSRETIIGVLDKFRAKFEENGNENASDMVLGIMDRLTGWTSTQFRL